MPIESIGRFEAETAPYLMMKRSANGPQGAGTVEEIYPAKRWYSHSEVMAMQASSTAAFNRIAAELERLMKSRTELNEWEIESVKEIAAFGAVFEGYSPAERDRWKALKDKLEGGDALESVGKKELMRADT